MGFTKSLAVAAAATAFNCAEAATITAGFDDLNFSGGATYGIGNSYSSQGINFYNPSGLYSYGSGSPSYPGLGSFYAQATSTTTLNYNNGQAFNFSSAVFADRFNNTVSNVTLVGNRVGGGTVNTTITLDGGSISNQTFSFPDFTNLLSLQVTGGAFQWNSVTINTVEAQNTPFSATFNNVTVGTVGNYYSEAGLNFSSSQVMTVDGGVGIDGPGSITITASNGGTLSLETLNILDPNWAFEGTLKFMYADGTEYESVTTSGGLLNQSALSFLANGRLDGLTSFTATSTANSGDNLRIGGVSGVITSVPEPEIYLPLGLTAAAGLARRRRSTYELHNA